MPAAHGLCQAVLPEKFPMMYRFRIHIHPRGENIAVGETVTLDKQEIATLAVEGNPASFSVTFDKASEILGTLPRMFIEPDGSFVWAGELDGRRWQVDGVLYDAGPGLAYVDLSGRCPPNEFDQFLAALGWPAAAVMFQLADAGVFVGEQEFRRWAGG